MTSLARALLAELDAGALDELAALLEPRLRRLAEPAGNGWLDTRGAAAYLGLSKPALHRLTSERRVPFSQDSPGARCYFRRSDLDDWRAQSARQPRYAATPLPRAWIVRNHGQLRGDACVLSMRNHSVWSSS